MKRDAYDNASALGRDLLARSSVNGERREAALTIKRLVAECRRLSRAVAAYGRLIDKKHAELAAALSFPGVPDCGAWPVLIEAVKARESQIHFLRAEALQLQTSADPDPQDLLAAHLRRAPVRPAIEEPSP